MAQTKYIGFKTVDGYKPFRYDSLNPHVLIVTERGIQVHWANGSSEARGSRPFVDSQIKNGGYGYLDSEIIKKQFPKLHLDADFSAVDGELTKYIGIKRSSLSVEPFDLLTKNRGYVFDTNEKELEFLYQDGSRTSTGWSKQAILDSINEGCWAYMNVGTFNKYFPKQTKVEVKVDEVKSALQRVGKSAEVAGVAFRDLTKLISKPMASALNIKKGSLYYNTTSAQVERVITIQDTSLVWTSRHKQEARPFPKSAFRLANQVEVDNYLNEAKANS